MITRRLAEAITAATEARERLNALADDAPDADRTAAVAALTAADRELREAATAEPDERPDPLNTDEPADPEARERRELRSRLRPGDYVRAAITARPVDGVAAEFAAACGCPGQMPLDAFEAAAPAPRRETRADAVTDGPAADTAVQTAPILPAIFRESVAASLGIDMPMVGAGQANYPVITQSVTAGPVAAGERRDATKAVITPQAVVPGRISGTVVWKKEDAALLMDLDTALVGDLQAVLADSFDQDVVTGDGVKPNIRGLATQLPLPAAAQDAAATTFAVLTQRSAGMVDGLFSTRFGDLRAVTSVGVYAYLASLFRANNTELTGLDWMMMKFGSVMANGRVTDHAKGAAGARGAVYVRRGRPVGRVAVLPVWQGVTLTRDSITGADAGTIKVVADMLVGGIAFLRPDAFGVFSVATTAKA